MIELPVLNIIENNIYFNYFFSLFFYIFLFFVPIVMIFNLGKRGTQ